MPRKDSRVSSQSTSRVLQSGLTARRDLARSFFYVFRFSRCTDILGTTHFLSSFDPAKINKLGTLHRQLFCLKQLLVFVEYFLFSVSL